MSHLNERKDKNCLNCNAHIHGKYCHICGQENVEPAESAWHLITHFFNDITHFDGKFFSTLKLLITKPGFLSAEYKRGRRASYLNPVRMYIFTSFIFFVIFFFTVSPKSKGFFSMSLSGVTQKEVDRMDSTEFAIFTTTLNREKKPMSRKQYAAYVDSLSKNQDYTIFGTYYKSEAEYDSLIRSGKLKQGAFDRFLTKKNFEIKKKYRTQRDFWENFFDKLFHYFPQVLFISLPFFAMLLKLVYFRHKDFLFVSHGIYSIHLFIFYFISLLVSMGLYKLVNLTDWSIFSVLNWLVTAFLFVYEYKAMRHFYGQRRAKTIFKFLLAVIGRFIILIAILLIFLALSFYNI